MKKNILFISILFLYNSLLAQTTYYVRTDGNNGSNGLSWTDAKKDIQDAIDVASAGDEIWVARGTYLPTEIPDGATEHINADDNSTEPVDPIRDKAIYLKSGVKLYGGFVGNESNLEERDFEANETILSGDFSRNDNDGGQLSGRDLSKSPLRADNARHVLVSINDDSDTQIDGFSVAGANVDKGFTTYIPVDGERLNSSSGGGMYLIESNMTIKNMKFYDNSANDDRYSNGGALRFVKNSNAQILDSEFYNNAAGWAGAVSSDDSGVLTNVKFHENTAYKSDGEGGAVYNYGEPTFIQCIFYDNKAGNKGGAIANSTYVETEAKIKQCVFYNNSANYGGAISSPTTETIPLKSANTKISNSLFYNNQASNEGGAIFNSGITNTMNLTNVTFYKNKATSNGGGLRNGAFGTSNVKNCVFWANERNGNTSSNGADISNLNILSMDNSLTQDFGINGIRGNIVGQDPLFKDEGNLKGSDGIWATEDDGLQLDCTSPAINSGDNGASNIGTQDIVGVDRIHRNTVDMGAYENPLCGDVIYTQTTDECSPVSSTPVSGNTFTYIKVEGDIIAAINPKGNDLGNVSGSVYIRTTTKEDGNGVAYLNRTIFLSPENNNISATIRYYFTQSELDQLITDSQSNTDDGDNVTVKEDLYVTQIYDASCGDTFLGTITPSESDGHLHEKMIDVTAVKLDEIADAYYLEIEVDRFSAFTAHGGEGDILPVELKSFSGQKAGNRVELNWVTSKEENNKEFNVLRSSNGIDFEEIGLLSGKGTVNNVSYYDFVDYSPLRGRNYYQIEFASFDGKKGKSNIVSVDFIEETIGIVSLNKSSITLVSNERGGGNLKIYNSIGEIVLEESVSLELGQQTISLKQSLQSGVYVIELIRNGKSTAKKFIVL